MCVKICGIHRRKGINKKKKNRLDGKKYANIVYVSANADVAELVDALVLGTSTNGVGVRVSSSAP